MYLTSKWKYGFGLVLVVATVALLADAQGQAASELNQKITNPVSDIWSLQSQFNNYQLAKGQWNNVWNFQPTLPVGLTKDWNLVTRPIMPLYDIARSSRPPATSIATQAWAT